MHSRRFPLTLCLIAASFIGCGRSARVAKSVETFAGSCYKADSSIIFPLGDITSPTAGSSGAWITLTNDLITSQSSNRRARAADVYGNTQEGAWWLIGDTVAIQTHDGFTTNDLRLVARDSLLVGLGRGITDHRTGDSVRDNPSWSARLRHIECTTVPRDRLQRQ